VYQWIRPYPIFTVNDREILRLFAENGARIAQHRFLGWFPELLGHSLKLADWTFCSDMVLVVALKAGPR